MRTEIIYHQEGRDALSDVFHSHEGMLELICIRSGRGTVFAGERVISFSGETILLIDGGALHYICPADDVRYVRHKLIFDKRLLCEIPAPFGKEHLFYRVPRHVEMLELERRLEELSRQYEQDGPSLLLYARVLELLHLCLEQGESKSNSYRGVVADAVSYIHENLAQGVTLSGVAAALHVNKYHLCRVFRRETGMTVGTYIHSVRITTAKRLLRVSDKSVGLISAECGFNEPSIFTRSFKKEVGMTPIRYRAQTQSTEHVGKEL